MSVWSPRLGRERGSRVVIVLLVAAIGRVSPVPENHDGAPVERFWCRRDGQGIFTTWSSKHGVSQRRVLLLLLFASW